ncbi:hypothetical protein BEL04_12715 [Mucilaginibacter sp. PPCGB 2223]|uniref:sensor histidine kinase n=1 Tax=Mucilaginibacter sp. PPCGB 2223 TaxID=1886027 RepID=UPI0008254995|nr:histidine kinase [Mucilaginibacter sp. PPCGB 2223]OCX52329.1 hypothetical protein BEL04_12715 [Mucilaginibacter sp. PPCGB 2223]
MKELKRNPLDLNAIEFWASTALYVFSVFILITQVNYGPAYRGTYYGQYTAVSGVAALFSRICRYTMLYVVFLLFNFRVWPALAKRQNISLYTVSAIALVMLLGITYAVTDTYLEPGLMKFHRTPFYFSKLVFNRSLMQTLWVLMMFGFYTGIKFISVHLLDDLKKVGPEHYQVSRESIIAFIGWLVVLFLLISTNANIAFIALWGAAVLLAIGIYWSSAYWIIPEISRKRQGFKHYMGRIVLIVLLSSVLISIATGPMGHNITLPTIMLSSALQILVVAPISWQVYKRRLASNAELYKLKTDLGRSAASYTMLQAQINPHFLFNALNTLYGTALQENAERTSEGIQQLGDMMRFMLHENMQQSISLSREIDYLHHFIALQQLRTQTSPDIVIQNEIPRYIGSLQITPMLLIPFVENAFKHGISLRESSYIKMVLDIKGNTLYFDVSNSIHIKPDNDPEKGHSGIGLNNLKQRLELVYPKRHELIIRETASEFFVHLTLQLSTQPATKPAN